MNSWTFLLSLLISWPFHWWQSDYGENFWSTQLLCFSWLERELDVCLMQVCVLMTCSLLCRNLGWSRALSKPGLVSSQWITLPSTEPVQSCRLSLTLEELFSILTFLVCAEIFSDCLVIKFLLLLALCSGEVADASGWWRGVGKLFYLILLCCTIEQTASHIYKAQPSNIHVNVESHIKGSSLLRYVITWDIFS